MASKIKAENASPWDALLDADDPELAKAMLAERGKQALASGEITPQQVQAAANPILKAAGVEVYDTPLEIVGGKQANTPQKAKQAVEQTKVSMGGTVNAPQPGDGPKIFSNAPIAQVAPIQRGSGLSSTQDFSNQVLESLKNSEKTQGNYLLTMDPEQLADIYGRTEKLPVFQKQQEGIDRMRGMLEMERDAPVDIFSGPLAGLLETEFGRKVGTMAAQRGPNAQDQRAKIMAYAAKIQDDQGALGKNIFDAISKQKAGSYTESTGLENNVAQTARTQSGAKAVDPRSMDKAVPRGPNPLSTKIKVFTEFQKYSGKDRESLQGAENAINLLNSGSKVGDQAVVSLMARASGEVGNLSGPEQDRYAGSRALGDRMRAALTKAETGRLDENDRADLILLAETYARYRRDLMKKNVEYFADNVGGELGLDSQSTKKMLMPDGGWGLKEEQINPKAKNAKGGEEMISVVGPNGVSGKIPKSKLDAALKKGYTLKPAVK